MRPLVQRTVEMIIPWAETAGGVASLSSCHSCSSFSASNKSQSSPRAFLLALLLACCSLLSLSFNTARTNNEKPFLFKLQEGLLSTFYINVLCMEVNSCFQHPVNCARSLDTWWCPFFMWFIGTPHEATCYWSDHVSELCMPLWPGASPSRSDVTLCLPRTQQSLSSLVLTALTSVSSSWKEMAWHPGPSI